MRSISYGAESVIDDMARDMSSVDTYSVTKTEDIHTKLIDFENWEALAYDLALGVASEEELAVGYGVDIFALENTIANDNFAKMLKSKVREVESLGDGADFTIKMRLIANKAAPKLLRRLLSNATEDKDFVKLFETATRLAQLEPSKEAEENPSVVVGTGISINLYGMPGLEHLSVNNSVEHEVKPTKLDIEDAEVTADAEDGLAWL